MRNLAKQTAKSIRAMIADPLFQGVLALIAFVLTLATIVSG
jgi:hypothetical protein